MEILIDRNKKLSFLQTEFRKHFSSLKIEFYDPIIVNGFCAANDNLLNNELTLKEVTKYPLPKVIKIYGKMTVQKLISAFADIYGLSVHVFQQAGDTWIQTSAMNNLTLESLHDMSTDEDVKNQKALK